MSARIALRPLTAADRDAFVATALLQQHRALLERCAHELLAKETLDEPALRVLTAELRGTATAR